MLSLLSPAVDFLNNAQPVASSIINGIVTVGWVAYIPTFLVVYAVW